MKLWRTPRAYDPERGSLRSFLAFSLLENTFQDFTGTTTAAAPPPELRDRILSDASKIVPISTGMPREVIEPPVVVDPPEVSRPVEVVSEPPDLEPAGNSPFKFVPWVAATAGLLFAVFSWTSFQDLDLTRQSLEAQLASAGQLQAQQDSLLGTFLGSTLHMATLADASGDAGARLFWNRDTHMFILASLDLPEAPSGTEYQLWAISSTVNPMSMGTFSTPRNANRILLLPVPQQITAFGRIELAAITVEPLGGSFQPTEGYRYRGRWLGSE